MSQNNEKYSPLTYKMLKKYEIGTDENNVEYMIHQEYDVVVDGIKAKCKILDMPWSERIGFKFEKKHPTMGIEFITKYFTLDEPGKLKWGFKDDVAEILVVQ